MAMLRLILLAATCLIAGTQHSDDLRSLEPEPWVSVWARKGAPAEKPSSVQDLIRVNGYEFAEDYLKVMQAYANYMRPYPADGVLCDIGCGSGAFLRVIPRVKVVLCIDLSQGLLKTSAEYNRTAPIVHLSRDATDLWGIPTGLCDITITMSVLQYLDDTQALQRATAEALRVTAPHGRAYFCDVRDGDKALYEAHRRTVGLAQSNHLFVPKSYWRSHRGATVYNLGDLLPQAHRYYYNSNWSYVVRVNKSDK